MNSTKKLRARMESSMEDIEKFGKTNVTFQTFYIFVQRKFEQHAYQFGDSETIRHVGTGEFVDRDSYEGEEAEGIQCGRRFNTFFKDEKLYKYYQPTKKESKMKFKPVPSLSERLNRNKV